MRGITRDEQEMGMAAGTAAGSTTPAAADAKGATAPIARLPRFSARRVTRPESWVSRDGFQVVARDDDGVGYLVLERFETGPRVRATALAAMRYLSGTTALLVDLRCTRRGDAGTAAFLTSLLFDTEPLTGEEIFAPAAALPTARNDARSETRNEARYLARHIVVLVSNATSPDALSFACNLARQGRAAVRMAAPAQTERCA
ncbi:MAG: hypothetical protein ACREOJ_13775 [Gemmatimonadaceae bacterium]